MPSSFVRLFAFIVLVSGCAPEVSDPQLTLGSKADLNRFGAQWYFSSPVVAPPTVNAAQVHYAFRVREVSGGFLTKPSKTVTYQSSPTQVEIPLDAKAQFPVGVPVNLLLEVIAMSWDGVETGLTIKSQNYTFTVQ